MTSPKIESFLERRIGLSAKAMGSHVITKAVHRRMAALGLTDMEAYHGCLIGSEKEQAALIESVVVPETWFFRNQKAFTFLAAYVAGKWLKKNPGRRPRALSIPCATGEEAYSIAMALMDAGIRNDQFHIDGVDISKKSLAGARKALYGRASFRGTDLSFRDRYFDPSGDDFQLRDEVRGTVRFFEGNILDHGILKDQGPYDIIFCRNLLIYLSDRAKERTLEVIDRLLSDSGILFLGHAERGMAVSWGMAGIPEFGVFACRKGRRRQARPPQPTAQPRSFGRRVEKIGTTLPPLRPSAAVAAVDTVVAPAASDRTPEKEVPVAIQRDLFEEARRLADKGSLNPALDLCQEFLRDHPIHAGVHFLMGLIYEALDREESAEACFNKAIYLDPNHSEALNHLSFILEARGDKVQAAHLRARALRASQKQATV
jgi:chemotaxis protein methyltransferase WspC